MLNPLDMNPTAVRKLLVEDARRKELRKEVRQMLGTRVKDAPTELHKCDSCGHTYFLKGKKHSKCPECTYEYSTPLWYDSLYKKLTHKSTSIFRKKMQKTGETNIGESLSQGQRRMVRRFTRDMSTLSNPEPFLEALAQRMGYTINANDRRSDAPETAPSTELIH